MMAKATSGALPHLLYVDDEEFVRSALRRTLRRSNISVTVVDSGEAALSLIAEDPTRFTVVASDHDMGAGMNGTTFLGRVAKIAPAIPRILVSGHLDSGRLLQAINSSGVFHVVEKPWDGESLVDVVQRASEQCEITRANARLLHWLETENAALGKSNCDLEERLEKTRHDVVRALLSVLGLKDRLLRTQAEEIACLAVGIGELVGLSEPHIEDLRDAALLHDLCRLGTEFMALTERLPEEDRATLECHPRVSAELLEGVEVLAGAAAIVRDQGEHGDGSGAPFGKRGLEIHQGARVLAVVQEIARAPTGQAALEALVLGCGTTFEPELVEKIRAQGQPLLGG
jgi:response regulator RpfG family c-di-GMP phosphodiesterase